MKITPRISTRTLRCIAVVSVLAVGPAIAEDLHVGVNYVDILDDPSSAGSQVARVNQGSTVTVLEHDGRWMKVQYNGQVGYVNQKALTPDNVQPMSTGGTADNTTSMNVGAAGRGFDENQYAQAKGYTPAPLENLITLSKTLVKPADLRAFEAAGHVGPMGGAK
jgi:hypothetical protein